MKLLALRTIIPWLVQHNVVALETTEMPAIPDVRTNATRISETLERTSAVAEQTPSLVRSEREERIKAIAAQETQLTLMIASALIFQRLRKLRTSP